jgi:hypothetical protein
MLRRLLGDRLILVLAVTAGLWMYASAMVGLTDLDRRLELAWSQQQSRPAPETPPAIHGTPVRFNEGDCPARERRLHHRTDRTL